MADLSCINIQPVKGGSEEHNRRLKTLDYVRPDLPHLYWQSDTQAERLATIRDRYTAMTGQRMQAKATPIREGFVRLSERHTMEDLHRLADALHAQFGIKTFQIAMHLDEGHWGELEDGERPQDFEARTIDGVRSYWKPNRHAHLVFDWTDDKTGKSIKLNAKAMSRMQTLVADVLGMERGVSSDKDHLTALQWKNQEQAKANARLMAKAHDLDAAIAAKEQRIDQASGKAKEIGAAAIEGLHTLLQPGKARQERAAEVAAARADERAKVIQEVQKSAGLTLPDATAESIGQSWGSWYSTAAQRTKDLKAAAIENQGLKAKAEKAEGDATRNRRANWRHGAAACWDAPSKQSSVSSAPCCPSNRRKKTISPLQRPKSRHTGSTSSRRHDCQREARKAQREPLFWPRKAMTAKIREIIIKITKHLQK